METNRKGIITLLMSMFVISSLTSCASRKVDRSKTELKETAKIETTKIDSSKTTTITNINTKVVDSSDTEEMTIEPIDNSKEMVINGKTYKNAVLKHKKVKNNIVVDKSELINKIQQSSVKEVAKAETSKTLVVEMKKIDKSASYWWLLWFLLLIPVYYIYKKF